MLNSVGIETIVWESRRLCNRPRRASHRPDYSTETLTVLLHPPVSPHLSVSRHLTMESAKLPELGAEDEKYNCHLLAQRHLICTPDSSLSKHMHPECGPAVFNTTIALHLFSTHAGFVIAVRCGHSELYLAVAPPPDMYSTSPTSHDRPRAVSKTL